MVMSRVGVKLVTSPPPLKGELGETVPGMGLKEVSSALSAAKERPKKTRLTAKPNTTVALLLKYIAFPPENRDFGFTGPSR
jgi:hypothetical protein